MVKRKILVEDLRKFKYISDPQISPDGDQVVFRVSTIDYENDRYERHLWMADLGSGRVEQFTFGKGSDSSPSWSPDGSHILFLSRGRVSEKNTEVFVIPRSGGEARPAFETGESVDEAEWAPDSEHVLFLSRIWTEEKPKSDVKVIKRIKYKQNGFGTFEGRRTHLFVSAVDGRPRQLTTGEYDVEAAAWSPDGKRIAFVANMGEDADTNPARDIYVMPVRRGVPVKVTDGKHVISDVSWSPDGISIAFIGHDKPRGFAINLDIWLVPSGGGDARNLTKSLDRCLMKEMGCDLRVSTPNPGAVWSHDGKRIFFVTSSIPYCNVYEVDVSTGDIKEFIGNRTIDGFSISKDDSAVAFNALNSVQPAELWVRDKGGERRLTSFNDKLLEDLDLSVPEHFFFRNPAGQQIDAWMMKPVGFKEDVKYPAVLEIHGGPGSVYGDGMFHEFQLLAAAGFAVMYTNPRGSGGYDEAYARDITGSYGMRDYDDFMVFVDQALEKYGFIDRDRLGVTGGSYGGYMTNWITSHTGRFKAAVTDRCVSNWVSKFATSDIGYTQPEAVGGDWDYLGNMEKHLARSPIRYVKNVKTPTLMIHSENDLRCPIEQGEQWFVALKLQGVPTELVRFPDENHELSRSGKPKHREERLNHILRWLNKYL